MPTTSRSSARSHAGLTLSFVWSPVLEDATQRACRSSKERERRRRRRRHHVAPRERRKQLERCRLLGRRSHQHRSPEGRGRSSQGTEGNRQAACRRADERQCAVRQLGSRARERDFGIVVFGRGGRNGDWPNARRRQQSFGTVAGDVLHRRQPASGFRRLLDEGPHVPLLQRQAALSLRLRPQLLALCLWQGEGFCGRA